MSTQEQFLSDVAGHKITVIRDDGVYRHLRFSHNGSSTNQFDLITWPGYLCYCGDMGTFVFSRLTDMFEFFRDKRIASGLHINLGYWCEKLVAVDGDGRHKKGSAKEYSEKKFRAVIQEYLDDIDESSVYADLRSEVEDRVLAFAHDENEAFSAVNEFEHNGFQFQDFFEYDLTEYTYRFIWCCYALVWGIVQYDLAIAYKKKGLHEKS